MSFIRSSIACLVLFLIEPIEIYSQQPVAADLLPASWSESVKALTSEITHKAKRLQCDPANCRLLVTNFVLPGGQTSPFGIQLADALTAQLSSGERPFRVVDRSVLQTFVQRQRLTAHVQSDDTVARWLGRQLGADALIVGKTTPNGKDAVEVSVTLLRAVEKERVGAKAKLVFDSSTLDSNPTDGLEKLKPFAAISDTENIRPANTKGLPPQKCLYTPNPSYTPDARDAHYSGIVTLDAFIDTNGEVQPWRIVKGAPYGLNDSAIKTLRHWKCQPVEFEGRPVKAIVSFEVNFRLY